MDRQRIKDTLLEQSELFGRRDMIVERRLPENIISTKKITVITGIRRCGKSTLLKQISRNVPNFGYANFEDERFLDFSVSDFNTMLEIFMEINPSVDTFFFDEIQNIAGWEKFVRRLFTEGFKIFVTGSSANLLASEIATSLTGRNIPYELYPFSFREFVSYHGFEFKDNYLTQDRSRIFSLFEKYLKLGGFPEVAISEDENELRQIYQDVIIKDLIVRMKIRDSKEFRDLAMFFLSNLSKRVSYNKLRDLLGFSNTSKVKNYTDFMTEAYLFFEVAKYDPSLKKQMAAPRKVYCIDTGIANAVSFMFSENRGAMLENMVFLELRRMQSEIFYHDSGKECDFILREKGKIVKAIQVTKSMAEPATRKREIEGLVSAMDEYGLDSGLILTEDGSETIRIGNKGITVMPIWKWLIG